MNLHRSTIHRRRSCNSGEIVVCYHSTQFRATTLSRGNAFQEWCNATIILTRQNTSWCTPLTHNPFSSLPLRNVALRLLIAGGIFYSIVSSPIFVALFLAPLWFEVGSPTALRSY